MTGFVARVTRPVTLVNQELLTHPEYLISLPVLIGDCVSQAFGYFYVIFTIFCYFNVIFTIFAYFLIHCDFILKQTFASIPMNWHKITKDSGIDIQIAEDSENDIEITEDSVIDIKIAENCEMNIILMH
jgi:uncharacterized membrane-anchored protein YitT (DUF2179 family)